MWDIQIINDFDLIDVIDESIWTLLTLIVCIAMIKLYLVYKKKIWLLPGIAGGIYFLGNLLDLVDEFHSLPDWLDIIESHSKLVGYSIFVIGIFLIGRDSMRMAERDPLTDIYNRRFIYDVIQKEIERAKHDNHPLTIAFFDVDKFKKINDTFGHLAGDQVLKELSSVLKQSVRARDTVCRFGGDEFVIVFPDTSSDNAEVSLNRFREALAGVKLPQAETIDISIGTAQFPRDGSDIDQLLAFAGKMMYDHKRKKFNDNINTV